MFVGHFATGLAIKSFAPKVKALPIIMGVGLIDVLDGVFIMAGANQVEPNLDAGPYLFFDLVFIDWDHSLLMALIWSSIWGLIFLRNGRATAALAFGAAISHWLTDLPLHNADLAVYPFSQYEFGFGLWGSLHTGAWVLEGIYSAIMIGIAWWKFRSRAVSLVWPIMICLILFVNLSPWLSPMKLVAGLGDPADYLLHGALVTLGFLVPGFILSWLVDRGERRAEEARTAQVPSPAACD